MTNVLDGPEELHDVDFALLSLNLVAGLYLFFAFPWRLVFHLHEQAIEADGHLFVINSKYFGEIADN